MEKQKVIEVYFCHSRESTLRDAIKIFWWKLVRIMANDNFKSWFLDYLLLQKICTFHRKIVWLSYSDVSKISNFNLIEKRYLFWWFCTIFLMYSKKYDKMIFWQKNEIISLYFRNLILNLKSCSRLGFYTRYTSQIIIFL